MLFRWASSLRVGDVLRTRDRRSIRQPTSCAPVPFITYLTKTTTLTINKVLTNQSD